MTERRKIQNNPLRTFGLFGIQDFFAFSFVSDFDIRISDFS